MRHFRKCYNLHMCRPIYLDYNANTPLLSEVADAIDACHREPLLNPASQHRFGQEARRRLEQARQRTAEILGAATTGMHADRVIFTGSGTEANNLAVFGLVGGRDAPAGHLIVSAIEHPSVSAAARHLAGKGWKVDWLGVDAHGVARPADVAKMLRPETRLVALMLGNNETGSLQPVAEIAEVCRPAGVPVHTDAAQVVGKLPVDFRSLGVATLSLAAHKLHGPLGIGALVVRHGITVVNDLHGGSQQGELRPGTESVALAVGLLAALELWHADRDERPRRLAALRDRFEAAILAGWPDAVIISRDATRLPHTSNLGFVGLDRQLLFMALDQAGVACSTGSACASGSSELSPVHVAMGCDPRVAAGALRFSLGVPTTTDEVDEAARRILRVAKGLPRTAGA